MGPRGACPPESIRRAETGPKEEPGKGNKESSRAREWKQVERKRARTGKAKRLETFGKRTRGALDGAALFDALKGSETDPGAPFDAPDLELDFRVEDFVFVESEMEPTRIMPPSMPRSTIVDRALYDHARELAEKVDLSSGARTVALVSGNFIFGDLIEALILERGIDAEEITISTLSLSEDNVDSLRNILEEREVERLNLCVSAYFYSHNRDALVPYIYQELDIGERLQVAFCNTHCKVCLIASRKGTRYVLHGSANLRSSGCLEQIELEESPALYAFYARTLGNIIEKYPTIDHKRPKIARGETSWRAVLEGAGEENCGEAARRRSGGGSASGAPPSPTGRGREGHMRARRKRSRSDGGGVEHAEGLPERRAQTGQRRGSGPLEEVVPEGRRPSQRRGKKRRGDGPGPAGVSDHPDGADHGAGDE